MFGKNAIEKKIDGDGKSLDVKEIFYTLQGEGPYAGCPSVFIRLAGCHLACTFCDTNFEKGEELRLADICDRVDAVWKFNDPGLIVLTGGEPCRQPIDRLVSVLIGLGWKVQIETAGSFWRDCMNWEGCDVVVSPKNGFVHKDVASVAVAWKYIVDINQDVDTDGLPITDTQGRGKARPLAKPTDYSKVWLSPMDRYDEKLNRLNVALVASHALQFGYRAGLQMHKIFQLR